VAARAAAWCRAVAESRRLADEWDDWLHRGAPVDVVEPL
jgi:hypothetical protein